jgi:hypothetical protein
VGQLVEHDVVAVVGVGPAAGHGGGGKDDGPLLVRHAVVGPVGTFVVGVAKATGIEKHGGAARELPGGTTMEKHRHPCRHAQPKLLRNRYVLHSFERVLVQHELHVPLEALAGRLVECPV